MAEMRLQNNEVIGELKAQVKEVKEERAILEESSRRALESEKTEKGQRVKELTTLKGDVEKLNQELDAERANNACAGVFSHLNYTNEGLNLAYQIDE